jgi:hypothetical protein
MKRSHTIPAETWSLSHKDGPSQWALEGKLAS